MRIATWNVERLEHKAQLDQMLTLCRNAGADILVLTETDSRIRPDYKYVFQTPALKGVTEPAVYKDTENRVSIYTNYECTGQYRTYDENTAICIGLNTERGNLLVYGTIIGISGNRRKSYREDLDRQLEDIRRLSQEGHNICVIGDYNCTFCDNYYYTNYGRESTLKCFSENHISILTADRPECIDHIAITDSFVGGLNVTIDEWNEYKKLSDHKGIVISF